jgi:predicted TPR repeat methyltransferase
MSVSTIDEEYVKSLFNDYAKVYDDHVKKILYAAPRVIRQELAKIYKAERNKTDSLSSLSYGTEVVR